MIRWFRTIFATIGSVRKWKRIAFEGGLDRGPTNCPLCVLYKGYWSGCRGWCPVFKRTKEQACLGTPYSEWIRHHNLKHAHSFKYRWPRVYCEECKEIAISEFRFLRGLLPWRRKI